MNSRKKVFIYGILIPLVVGGLSGLLSMGGMQEFKYLIQPPLSPPAFLFPIVWSILFILMGIASARVYLSNSDIRRSALIVYGVQLIFNFFWSLIFFNMQAFLFAFIWLVILWLLILITIAMFSKADSAAAWLLVPYLLWVTFAGYLNLGVYILNA